MNINPATMKELVSFIVKHKDESETEGDVAVYVLEEFRLALEKRANSKPILSAFGFDFIGMNLMVDENMNVLIDVQSEFHKITDEKHIKYVQEYLDWRLRMLKDLKGA